jgi:quercetin dioxygenase-like cupin family protein
MGDADHEDPVEVLTGLGSPRLWTRRVVIAPGRMTPYAAADWRGALVIVVGGEIELETGTGVRSRFLGGDVLWFDGLDLRRLRNPGHERAVLLAVSRIPSGG